MSIEDDLLKLSELKEKGAITTEEFEARKAQLLKPPAKRLNMTGLWWKLPAAIIGVSGMIYGSNTIKRHKSVSGTSGSTVQSAADYIPEGAVSTRFGLLQVKDNAGKKELLLLPSTLIYQEEVDYLRIEQVFKIGDSDAVLISSSCGGTSCTPSYFFVTLQANSKPILSPQFTPNVGGVKPAQKGDTVTIDLGWRDGFQETLVYETGKISVQRQVSTKKARADVADCDYLYQEIYLPYVQERWCHTNPDSPMLAASMAQLRGYEALANDSRLNMDFFRKLSQFGCETQQAIAYEQFQQQVCGR